MTAPSTVAQTWPTANGFVVLTVLHNTPNAEAVRLLGPVVAAIEAYQTALAAIEVPT